MTSAEERIKELARAKSLDGDDAARLLEAVRAPAKPAARESVLKNPFARYSGEITAAAGVVVSALGVFVSRVGVRFDGALDLHTSSAPVTLRVALIDQLVAFPLTALVFWIVARIAARHVRVVDVVGAVGLSRAPAVVFALPLGLLALRSPPGAGTTPVLGLLIACALAGLGAQIYLLFMGFRTASGLRGGRLAALFIGAVVLAEIATKVALSLSVS